MISTTELSMANAIAHGDDVGYAINFRCENCGHYLFQVLSASEKKGNRYEDVIIERTFYLKCVRCGSEEATRVMTIVPSWSGPCINRDTLPEWEPEGEE